jgi:HAD superfamily hydrolase (TIGR01450 family)
MVEQSVSSSVARLDADSLLDAKAPQIDPGARDRTMGGVDPLDVVDEVKRMFCMDDPAGGCRPTLTYEDFVLLLNECSVDSALFGSLLRFGEDSIEAGVEERLRGLLGGVSAPVGRESSSHILDDGSPAWRESIEAAFDLCDQTNTGQINKDVLDGAVLKYPLIAQLLRVPVGVSPDDQQEYMRNLYDSIDDNHSDFIDRAEWIRFFCPDREAVPRPTEWNEEREDCHRITGFIFDCDGTIYQPDGLIPGAEDVLTWIERSGRQYVLLSNNGALPYSAVYDKLSRCAFECKPDGEPIPPGCIYTAHDSQVDFMLSGHLPSGSKLLVLAPDGRWKAEMRERMPKLFDSWEIADDMDVDTAKEWAQRTQGEKVAIVFFHDGVIAQPWSYGLIHAMTILINAGADFIYTAEDHCNPSTDPLYEGVVFPVPGPGMFVEMLKNSMPPGTGGSQTFCCGKGGNVGRTFMIDRAIQMLKAQGHCGERDRIVVIGDRFDTDVRAGVLAGTKSCLLESGAHRLEMADDFPTDIPSYTCSSIAKILPQSERLRKAEDLHRSRAKAVSKNSWVRADSVLEGVASPRAWRAPSKNENKRRAKKLLKRACVGRPHGV